MLNASEITMKAVIYGYERKKGISKKTGLPWKGLEISYVRERKTDEEAGKFGAKADSFMYFFANEEEEEKCDISWLLEKLKAGKAVKVEMTGLFKNFSFNPSNIEEIK